MDDIVKRTCGDREGDGIKLYNYDNLIGVCGVPEGWRASDLVEDIESFFGWPTGSVRSVSRFRSDSQMWVSAVRGFGFWANDFVLEAGEGYKVFLELGTIDFPPVVYVPPNGVEVEKVLDCWQMVWRGFWALLRCPFEALTATMHRSLRWGTTVLYDFSGNGASGWLAGGVNNTISQVISGMRWGRSFGGGEYWVRNPIGDVLRLEKYDSIAVYLKEEDISPPDDFILFLNFWSGEHQGTSLKIDVREEGRSVGGWIKVERWLKRKRSGDRESGGGVDWSNISIFSVVRRLKDHDDPPQGHITFNRIEVGQHIELDPQIPEFGPVLGKVDVNQRR